MYMKTKSESLCIQCKGGKMLCGKTSCPLLLRIKSYATVTNRLGIDIDGASPPSIFVGRMGYPNVFVGPMVPPVHEDTSLYDSPEQWMPLTIREIVQFRMQLIRGKKKVKINDLKGKVIDSIQELALSGSPADVEMQLMKRPRAGILLDDEVQPMGPSAPLKDVWVGPANTNKRIEKAFYDTDLKAAEAVRNLHKTDIPLSKIQRGLSAGLFGVEKRRKLVPTRWSITAVDSMLSQNLMEKVKRFPAINSYLLYEEIHLDNRFLVLMLPDAWSYECMEAWYPGTIWNPASQNILMFGDAEPYTGRTTYATIGGCYYAARLAVNEHLLDQRRQARVIILREAHPGYIMPVGVWNVRESVREALRRTPQKFDTFEELLKTVEQKLAIPLDIWKRNSRMLKDSLQQKKITDYF
ncbi:MAG: hypothetical protein AYK18_02105 [Theionarchaea archaeon DG-70]|nr:MAG: hypothetical protein AYK18_02105 [Theionarchaea archaeon DG-70]